MDVDVDLIGCVGVGLGGTCGCRWDVNGFVGSWVWMWMLLVG